MEDEILQHFSNLQISNNASGQNTNNFTNDQLRDIVSIVTATLNNINSINTDTVETESLSHDIDFSNTSSALESEKIPDIVKSLREFSGKPEEFASWKRAVDRILLMYECYKGKPKYFAIMHAIRHKIVGNADIALESYRTPIKWDSIKKCLMMHYSDKRDIGTLEYQLTTMTQGNSSINSFYQRVYQHLSLILNKIDCVEASEDTLASLSNMYRDKALDTFIRGLNGDLPRLLSIKEPTSLPQALHMCLKLDNMTFRMHHAQANTSNRQNNNYQPNQTFNRQQNQFYPELAHMPKPQRLNKNKNFIRNNSPFSNQNVARNPPLLPPKPPVPMEVDESLHSAAVNYQNRPNNQVQNRQNNYVNNSQRNIYNGNNNHNRNYNAQKRQASNQNLVPNKIQRNFHLNQQDNLSIETPKYYCNNQIDDSKCMQEQPLQFEDDVNFLGEPHLPCPI